MNRMNRSKSESPKVTAAGNGQEPAASGESGDAAPKPRKLALRDVRGNPKIKSYIEKANEQMAAIGYTEHGIRHAALVAAIARNTLTDLGRDPREAELAAVAGYMHDIGNVVSRFYHPQIGATMAFTLLNEIGFEADEI